MQGNNDQNEDCQRKVLSRGGIAERFPANEEDDDSNPKNRAESTKDVEEDLLKIVLPMMGNDVLAVSLQTCGCGGGAQSSTLIDIEFSTQAVGGYNMEVQAFEVVLVGLLLLCLDNSLLGGVLGFRNLDGDGSELNWQFGHSLDAASGAMYGIAAYRTGPIELSRLVDRPNPLCGGRSLEGDLPGTSSTLIIFERITF